MNCIPRSTVTIDIEALPSLHPVGVERNARKGDNSADDHARTTLSGDFERILCIEFANEDQFGRVSRGVLGWGSTLGKFSCDEHHIISAFWEMMRGFRPNVDRIVGHNLFDFDLKFIHKRSVVHGVPPTVELSFARYRNHASTRCANGNDGATARRLASAAR